LIGDNLFLHSPNDEVNLTRALSAGPIASSETPLLVRLVREEAKAIPFVGLLPKWIPPAGVWLALSDTSSDLHSAVSNEPDSGPNGGPVVIVAHKRDKTSAHLIHNARSLGREVLFFDVAAIHSDENDSVLSELRSAVANAGFVFVRAIVVDPSQRTLARQFELLRTLYLCSSTIVNRPGAGFSNASKPAHLLELRNLGFSIPDSVATNCPDDAFSFFRTNSDVVFKSCSSERSIATKLVEEEARFALLPNCPVLFQSYLPGPDCRVHTVASKTFSLEISCDSIDYRYHQASFERVSLPSGLSEQLVLATRRMGLEIAGADFKKDVNGQWRILEINPMPAFEGFDHHLNQEIVVSLSKIGLLNEQAA
jgi:glutathione synthase/RimK-type ligase-like ATP-grasp enzyme